MVPAEGSNGPEDDRRRRLLRSLRSQAPSESNLSEVVRIVLILTLRATRKSVPYRFVSSGSGIDFFDCASGKLKWVASNRGE